MLGASEASGIDTPQAIHVRGRCGARGHIPASQTGCTLFQGCDRWDRVLDWANFIAHRIHDSRLNLIWFVDLTKKCRLGVRLSPADRLEYCDLSGFTGRWAGGEAGARAKALR